MLDHFPFNAKQAHCFGGFNGVADGFWAAKREREQKRELSLIPTNLSIVQPGALKWKSQETTKASTKHATRNLSKRCPCQKLRVSDGGTAGGAVEVLASLHCSMGSVSLTPTTFSAVEPQISQILE